MALVLLGAWSTGMPAHGTVLTDDSRRRMIPGLNSTRVYHRLWTIDVFIVVALVCQIGMEAFTLPDIICVKE